MNTSWLLTKILGDDLVSDEQGNPQIGEGTAPDRIISVTEPKMRHGRKSKSRRFDGFKALSTTEPSSELLVDIADIPATESEGAHLLPVILRVEAQAQVVVERVKGTHSPVKGVFSGLCGLNVNCEFNKS